MLYTARKAESLQIKQAAIKMAEFLLRRANADIEQYLRTLMNEMFDPQNRQAIKRLITDIKKDQAFDKSTDILNTDMNMREQFLNKVDELLPIITHPILQQDLLQMKEQIFKNELSLHEAEALLQAIHFKQADFEDIQEAQTDVGDSPLSIRPEPKAQPATVPATKPFAPLWSDEGVL